MCVCVEGLTQCCLSLWPADWLMDWWEVVVAAAGVRVIEEGWGGADTQRLPQSAPCSHQHLIINTHTSGKGKHLVCFSSDPLTLIVFCPFLRVKPLTSTHSTVWTTPSKCTYTHTNINSGYGYEGYEKCKKSHKSCDSVDDHIWWWLKRWTWNDKHTVYNMCMWGIKMWRPSCPS